MIIEHRTRNINEEQRSLAATLYIAHSQSPTRNQRKPDNLLIGKLCWKKKKLCEKK